jgi:hypothetical protein
VHCFRTVVVLAAAAAFATTAQPALAAPTPVSATRFVVTIDRKLETKLLDNCTLVTSVGWPEGDRYKNQQIFGGGGPAASGAYDLATRTGRADSSGDALQLEPLGWNNDEYRRAAKLSDVGLEVVKGRAYMTGRVSSAKGRSAAKGARKRLAVIAKPKFFSGPAHATVGGSPIPNSFLFAFQGNATVLPPLAAAMEQTRCKKSRFRGQRNGRIRAGARLGQVTAQMGVAAATGLDGTVELSGEPWLSVQENDAPVVSTPTGGAKRVIAGKARSIRFALTPGTRVQLACLDGYKCEPRAGTYGLVGGFTLSLEGKTATVGDLSITYATPSPDAATSTTINGTLDGQQVTFALGNGDPYPTSDFLQRVGAAWGTSFYGGFVRVTPAFTSTGPAS